MLIVSARQRRQLFVDALGIDFKEDTYFACIEGVIQQFNEINQEKTIKKSEFFPKLLELKHYKLNAKKSDFRFVSAQHHEQMTELRTKILNIVLEKGFPPLLVENVDESAFEVFMTNYAKCILASFYSSVMVKNALLGHIDSTSHKSWRAYLPCGDSPEKSEWLQMLLDDLVFHKLFAFCRN